MAQSTGRVAGKKAFITGGAQGLGAAAGRMLASEGAKVSLADLNLAGAQAVADEINAAHGAGTAFAFQLDVTQEDQWIEVLEKADRGLGGLSVLVNNAGIGGDGPIESLDFGLWKKVMSVNVDSVFLGAKHALTHMRAHQPGSIINLSSIAGLIANGNSPAYNASKAAVWLLSKNIALYCAKMKLDIRSNSIHPTFIDTPILDGLHGAVRQGRGLRQAGAPGAAGPHRRAERHRQRGALPRQRREQVHDRRRDQGRRRHLGDVT
jgi:NAD(P)-dependent dehydrogenase (short-subunit alcohol dehydrogenase family)